MNHIHRSIWNRSTGTFVAAPEHAHGSGKAQLWVEISVGMVGPFSKRAALKKGTAGKLLKQLLLL